MTKVVFSPFFKPEFTPGKRPGPQYLRLATTSLGNTIDVETFELQPVSSKPKSRYILNSARTRVVNSGAKYLLIAVLVAVAALLLQGFVDPEGSLTRNIVPARFQKVAADIKTPGAAADEARKLAQKIVPDTPAVAVESKIRDLLHLHKAHTDAPAAEKKAIIIHHDPDADGTLSTEVHAGEEDVVKKHAQAKKWDELSQHEQKVWKEKLAGAGMWAVDEGETILKSIFFGQLAGLVGQVAQGAIG